MQCLAYSHLKLEGTNKDRRVQVPKAQPYDLVSSRCSLNSDRLETLITSLGSLFQWPTTLSVKNIFLMSSLKFPWHGFIPFPYILLLLTRADEHLPLRHCPPWGSCQLWWGHPSAFTSQGWRNSDLSHLYGFPLRPFTILVSSSGHTLIVYPSCIELLQSAHRTSGVEQLPLGKCSSKFVQNSLLSLRTCDYSECSRKMGMPSGSRSCCLHGWYVLVLFG